MSNLRTHCEANVCYVKCVFEPCFSAQCFEKRSVLEKQGTLFSICSEEDEQLLLIFDMLRSFANMCCGFANMCARFELLSNMLPVWIAVFVCCIIGKSSKTDSMQLHETPDFPRVRIMDLSSNRFKVSQHDSDIFLKSRLFNPFFGEPFLARLSQVPELQAVPLAPCLELRKLAN